MQNCLKNQLRNTNYYIPSKTKGSATKPPNNHFPDNIPAVITRLRQNDVQKKKSGAIFPHTALRVEPGAR